MLNLQPVKGLADQNILTEKKNIMVIEIRRATPKDADAVRFLFRDTVSTINAKDYSPEEIAVWMDHYKNTTGWVNKINDQYFYVAEVEKVLVGFSSINSTGYLDFLYIHKDFQGKGVARALLNEIIKLAAELKLTAITTHSSKTARPLFEKHGFVKTGEKITKVQDVVFENQVMVKTL